MLTRRLFMKLGFISTGLAGLGGLSLSGCKNKHRLGSIDVSKAAIGVIRTHDDVRRTRVYYLNRDLEIIGSVLIDKAGVASSWTRPSMTGDELFLPVDGLFPAHDGNEVICLNVLTQELETWSVELPQQAAGCDTHVFAFDNYGGVLHVTSFERKSGGKRVYEISGGINTTILWHEGSLWVSRVALNDDSVGFDRTDMFQLTPSLELINQTSITSGELDFEFSMANVTARNGIAYYTASEVQGRGIKHICIFNHSTYEYEWVSLEEEFPYSISFADSEMIVLHSDVRGRKGNSSICVYTPECEFLRKNTSLGMQRPEQLAVFGKTIFVSDMDSIYSFDLETLEPIGSIEVDPEGECYRNVALFAMPDA